MDATAKDPVTTTPTVTSGETGTRHIRGPLRYQIGTSLPQLEAGKVFSVCLQITNPYDVPVTIRGVHTRLPVEFEEGEAPNARGQAKEESLVSGLKRSWAGLLKTESPRGTGDGRQLTAVSLGTGDGGPAKAGALVLQPGNSDVRVFALRSTRAIFFTPASYHLYLQAEYEIDGKVNQDVANYQLNIRAPLKALILGSMFGSTAGYLLRDIFDQKGLVPLLTQPFSAATMVPWLMTLMGNILLGAVLVIAFARKKDTQPILSIEDFWGGLFIGFLAGYTGKSLLDQFLAPGATLAPAANAPRP